MASRLMCILLSLAVLPCLAAYPERTVRIVSGFSPGNVTDVVTRPVATKLSESWKQPVIIDHRPGAGGALSAEIVAKSQPDGYTLLIGTVGLNAANASLYRKLPYDPLNAFAPITIASTSYVLLVTHPSLPVRSVKDLIALARSQPGKLSNGAGGNGTMSHLAGELFKSMAKVKITHVPYKGSPQYVVDLLAGRLEMGFASAAAVLPHIESGRLRLLALSADTRQPELPNVPTISEAGVPGYVARPWYGFFAAAGTPPAIVQKLSADIGQILAMADVKEYYAKGGMTAVSSTPEAFADYVASEARKWAKVVRDAGIQAE